MARKNAFDEPAEDLERARLRVAERTRDVGDRRHFLARTVLEDLGGHPDRSLVDLLDELLVAVLFLVIDLHVPEERLHPATNPPVLDVDLRVQREDARHHVELAVGAQRVVHGSQIGVDDLGIEIEVRAIELGSECSGDRRVTGVHEAARELHLRGARREVVAEVLQHEVRPRDEHLVGGRRAFVHPAELSVGDLEAVDSILEVRTVGAGVGRFGGRLHPGLLRCLRLLGRDVVEVGIAQHDVFEVHGADLRPVLDVARRRERPAAHGDVEAREHWFEVIERDLVQRDLGQHGRMGLGEEVGVTVQVQLAVIERDGAHLQR